jgi:hypothetical protein
VPHNLHREVYNTCMSALSSAIAKGVRRWVHYRVTCGIFGGRSGNGACLFFSQRLFGFPLLIIIPPLFQVHLSAPLRHAIAWNRQHNITPVSRSPKRRAYLRVLGDRVVKRIFEYKREKVTGGWRKLQNEGLHNLYSSPSIVRMNKSGRTR